MSSWDRRQLVQARGRLRLAARQIDLALERLDDTREATLRANWAWRLTDDAATDLRRFVLRNYTAPAVTPAEAGNPPPTGSGETE